MNNNGNPLWMPKGSVRALIALGLLTSTIAMFFYAGSVPEGLLVLDGAVVAWYFKKGEPT